MTKVRLGQQVTFLTKFIRLSKRLIIKAGYVSGYMSDSGNIEYKTS
jgi:hypothetical protein